MDARCRESVQTRNMISMEVRNDDMTNVMRIEP